MVAEIRPVPSMSIDVEKGLWYCFPCGDGGDGQPVHESPTAELRRSRP